jgi:integrase/recombinase XerD
MVSPFRVRSAQAQACGLWHREARAAKAGINEAVSSHWLRHAHGSHAVDRGASLPEVQAMLGHGNIATTSGYLHARPNTASGLHLEEGNGQR